ncbi:MAG: hypothetical protein AAFR88_12710, partial [Pseudomonadota bacterium]
IVSAMGPRAPKLGTTFFAAQLIDWAFFGLAIVGVEKVRIDPQATVMVPLDLYYYPFTHSLLASLIWALGFGLLVGFWQRNALAGALSGLVVLSHWVLDWVVHRPDLSLMGSPPYYGLGLWNYPEIAMPLEIGMTLGAYLYYVSRTRGPAAPPLILLGFMLVLQAFNWFAPHPEAAGLGLYLQALVAFGVLTAIAAWVGGNRTFVLRGGLAAPSL